MHFFKRTNSPRSHPTSPTRRYLVELLRPTREHFKIYVQAARQPSPALTGTYFPASPQFPPGSPRAFLQEKPLVASKHNIQQAQRPVAECARILEGYESLYSVTSCTNQLHALFYLMSLNGPTICSCRTRTYTQRPQTPVSQLNVRNKLGCPAKAKEKALTCRDGNLVPLNNSYRLGNVVNA